MPRPSVIPAVKERLEEYLDKCQLDYISQPELNRNPTLPQTTDAKVNVRALAKSIGLTQSQEKYLFERQELYSLVNMVAEGQGLRPIGARTEPADKAIQQRLVTQARSAKIDAQAAVEAKAREDALVQELSVACKRIAKLEAQNMRLQAQLEMINSGMLVRVAT
jgi:hypothetical protein